MSSTGDPFIKKERTDIYARPWLSLLLRGAGNWRGKNMGLIGSELARLI